MGCPCCQTRRAGVPGSASSAETARPGSPSPDRLCGAEGGGRENLMSVCSLGDEGTPLPCRRGSRPGRAVLRAAGRPVPPSTRTHLPCTGRCRWSWCRVHLQPGRGPAGARCRGSRWDRTAPCRAGCRFRFWCDESVCGEGGLGDTQLTHALCPSTQTQGNRLTRLRGGCRLQSGVHAATPHPARGPRPSPRLPSRVKVVVLDDAVERHVGRQRQVGGVQVCAEVGDVLGPSCGEVGVPGSRVRGCARNDGGVRGRAAAAATPCAARREAWRLAGIPADRVPRPMCRPPLPVGPTLSAAPVVNPMEPPLTAPP